MDIILKYFSDFSDKQLQQFKALEELYKDWNAKINVISRKDIDSLYEKHVLHSLSIAAVFDFPKGVEIVDIGTGGGFPGVPLAIFFPDVKFHLVDSIAKSKRDVGFVPNHREGRLPESGVRVNGLHTKNIKPCKTTPCDGVATHSRRLITRF